MSSCGAFYGNVTRTPVVSRDAIARSNERVDNDHVTPIRAKNRAAVDQKLDKVLEHLHSQKEENSRLREALTELNERVSELQKNNAFADSSNSKRRVPPGLSVSSLFSVIGFQFYYYR